jgi:hypothetical protein
MSKATEPKPERPPKTATLRRLLLLARPEWKLLGWGIFFLAIGSSMSLLYPQGMATFRSGYVPPPR